MSVLEYFVIAGAILFIGYTICFSSTTRLSIVGFFMTVFGVFLMVNLLFYPILDYFKKPDYKQRYRIVTNGARYTYEEAIAPLVWQKYFWTWSSKEHVEIEIFEKSRNQTWEWEEKHKKWKVVE